MRRASAPLRTWIDGSSGWCGAGVGDGGTGGGGFGGPGDGGGYASGGAVHGPGGPRSDSIPTHVSAGEFVLNAPACKAIEAVLGPGALAELNAIGNRHEDDREMARDEARALMSLVKRARPRFRLVPVDHDPFKEAANG